MIFSCVCSLKITVLQVLLDAGCLVLWLRYLHWTVLNSAVSASGVPWRRFLNVAMINSALRAPAGSRNSVIYIDQYYTVYSAEIASAGWRDSAIYWTVYTDQYCAVTALAGSYVSAIITPDVKQQNNLTYCFLSILITVIYLTNNLDSYYYS